MGRSMVKPNASPLTSVQSGVIRHSSRVGSLVTCPHPALEQPSYEIDPRAPDVVEAAAALIGTLRATPGCWSLSAPQLGHNVRLLCVDVTGHPDARSCAGLVVLANPEVFSVSGRALMREDCMSFPDTWADVGRAKNVVVGGTVPGSGRSIVITADAFEARRLLHELDHLDGISMLDRVIDATAHVHVRGRGR